MQNKIAQLRKEKNLSQEELAEKAGISRVSLSFIENGRVPNGDTMLKIAKALGKSVEEIFLNQL